MPEQLDPRTGKDGAAPPIGKVARGGGNAAPASRQGTPAKGDKVEIARRFAGLTFCWADMVFELDDNLDILFAAGVTQRLLGSGPGDLRGRPFLSLVDERDRRLVSEFLNVSLARGRIDEHGVHMPLANGAMSEIAIAGYRAPDFDNHFLLAVKVEPRRAPKRRQRAADHDEVSGVMNEKAFAAVAADRIKSYQQAGGKAKVSLVKIDNMEELKKNLSTENQNSMFSAVGNILKEYSLGGATAGRIDEENFSIVHGEDVSADQIGQKITEATSDITPLGIGISTQTATMAAEMADMDESQMTKALIYTMREFSQNPDSVAKMDLGGMLERHMADTVKAVASFKRLCKTRHFDLVFMPICDLKTRAVHHFEALTRFRGGGADMSPYKLITLAEEVGVIADFDLAVAEKAIEFINKQQDPLPSIAINVSGHSISNPDFVKKLHALLARSGDLTAKLTFEITESAAIEDLEGVNDTIQGFRQKGYRVALDDFGAGAASFDYLNSFDVDMVKFDGPVVKRAYATEKGKAFLASMATLCRQIGIETIAEMVEDKPLADFLEKCGIDLGQGYYFGKPDANIRLLLTGE